VSPALQLNPSLWRRDAEIPQVLVQHVPPAMFDGIATAEPRIWFTMPNFSSLGNFAVAW
jgi:hypothetical protein